MPHGSDIRAILSYSITMTLETYPDMPTDPDVPCFVDTFVSDLDRFLDTWFQEFLDSKDNIPNNGISSESASTSSTSLSRQQSSQELAHP